jgi:hypothetical protein
VEPTATPDRQPLDETAAAAASGIMHAVSVLRDIDDMGYPVQLHA